MFLPLLFDGRIDEYMAAVRQDAQLWLFVHVPKTAGSSLGTELAALQPPYCNIHIDHLDRSKPGPQRFDAAVERFLEATKERRFHSASGHIQHRHTDRISATLPGVRTLTMLRHPLARLISDYRYQRSPMHPLHAEVAQRTPDFESFSRIPGQRNRMARHLAPPELVRPDRVDDCVAYVLEHFAFVGLQERYALHFRALTALVSGRAHAPKEKKRVNDAGEAVEVTPALAAQLEAEHAVDFAIYRAVDERFSAVEAALSEWLAAQS